MSVERIAKTIVREIGFGAGMLLMLAIISSNAWADLTLNQASVDLGEVRAGLPLAQRFNFRNQGPEKIEITDLRGSCGCLRPQLDKRVFEIGEEGSLTVRVNTLGQPSGPHRWQVRMTYSAGNRVYVIPVQLTARIVTEISIQPASLTVFADRPVAYDLLLTDLRPNALAIKGVQASSPQMTAGVVGDFHDAAGHAVRKLRLEIAGDYPEGRHDEIVEILTDDPEYHQLRVPVTVIKRQPQALIVSPNHLSLQVPEGRSLASQMVVLRDHESRQIAIDEVVADDPALMCQWSSGPGHMATLRVSVARQQAVELRGETAVHIHVRQPMAETITLPVTYSLK
jgi:hypothetical protein